MNGNPSPQLTDLISTLERLVISLAPAYLSDVIGDLERVKTIALYKLMTSTTPTPAPAETGRYLTVVEVCERYGIEPRWLYRHKKQMPHSQPSRKVLLFPEKAIERWFASRRA